jgi:TonB family protein
MANLRIRESATLISVLLGSSLAVLLAEIGQTTVITQRDAKRHIGEVVTVCGRVTTHRCARPKRTTYLDLETPYWVDGLSIAIPADKRLSFGTRVEDRYMFRHLCATGRVDREGKRSVVTVSQPDQLRIDSEPQSPPVLLEPMGVRGCDDGVGLPQPVSRAQPEYPRDARASRREGIVLLDGVVETDGRVAEVIVVHSSAAEFDAAAVEAFKQWRFTPGTLAGKPVPVVVGVQLTFNLR